jgi:hypothetical protein
VIGRVVKHHPRAMDCVDVRGYLAAIALIHSPARVQA